MKISQRLAERGRPFYSLEFFPPKEAGRHDAFYEIAHKLMRTRPLFVSVTYGAGGSNQGGSLELVTELKRRFAVETMAHLTCIGADGNSLADYLTRLRAAGVDNILALRGDLPQMPGAEKSTALGEFRHAADLVRFVRAAFPGMGIAVAGYPTPHPESPSFASDWRYTVEKIRDGADLVVTQMFFDVREYEAFVDRLREMGVSVPVIPGVLPIQSFASLRRTLSMSGASIPGKLYLDMEAANEKGGVAAVREAGIAFAVRQIRMLLDAGAPGIHLYTLNQADTCLRIVDEAGAL
jgi:methylenetetrahydrofolate reductase (NADPH)